MPPNQTRLLGGRFAMLLGLTGLAIAQPLLSVLSGSPETFTFYNFNSTDIVVFALLLAFMPPTLLWAIETIIYLFNKNAAKWTHQTFCAALLTIFVQQLLVTIGLTLTALAWTLSISAGIALFIALTRVDALSSFLKLMGFLPFVAVALFLFSSPVANLVNPPSVTAVAAGESDEPAPSVIMIVLDEFPTQSIMNSDEQIDAERLPNLAEFATDATWYRHYTTMSPYTKSAVPAALTGLEPVGGVDWPSYPDNLFRLLGDTHHLTVAEPITTLCSVPGCTKSPVAPPVGEGNSSNTAAQDDADFSALWTISRDLLSDRVGASNADDSGDFDDFEESFESVESVTDNPQTLTTTATPKNPETAGRAMDQALQQPRRYNQFLRALEAGDQPTLYFLHLILPHQPWRFNEQFEEYTAPEIMLPGKLPMDGDWFGRLSRQRHLLQATYTDQLIGDLLQKAKDEGIYEDSLVVLLADHGIALEDGQRTRLFDRETISSLGYVPLLVKPPGQKDGRVDDANVSSIDVLPTMAAHLGVPIPWEVDGLDANSADLDDRDDRKWLNNLAGTQLNESYEYDDTTMYAKMSQNLFPPIDTDDALAGLWKTIESGPELLGRQLDELEVDDRPLVVSLIEGETLAEPLEEGHPPPGIVTGWIDSASLDLVENRLLALAIGGEIVSLSEIQPRNDRDGWFAAPIPSGLVPPLDLDIVLVDPDNGAASLATVE